MPIRLCLVREDSSLTTLKSWEKETVAQLLEREFGLRKQLRANLKFVFSDTAVPHGQRLEEAGIVSEAEVRIIGLCEALEAKQRELELIEAQRALQLQRRKQQERERETAQCPYRPSPGSRSSLCSSSSYRPSSREYGRVLRNREWCPYGL